jgi:hypothetical protein
MAKSMHVLTSADGVGMYTLHADDKIINLADCKLGPEDLILLVIDTRNLTHCDHQKLH